METIKEHLNIRDKKTLINEIDQTLQRINDYVVKNDYQLNGNIKQKLNLDSVIDDISLSKRKVLRRYMYHIKVHPTLDVVNKFLHFLFKEILKSNARVKVVKSEKEQLIMKKRQEYKAALKILLEKRQAYKDEKGDFYKLRLAKNQAI
jgi:hypothetical protein